MFLGDPQNQRKIESLKKQHFLAILRNSGIFQLNFDQFWLRFGFQVGDCFEHLSGPYVEVDFWLFFEQNTKTQKMQKCFPVRKIRCFVKVARFKKTQAFMNDYVTFLVEISRKINQKSTKKVGKLASATKIDKNAALGAPFVAWNRFWVDFWTSEGTQKSSKICE